MAKIKQKARDLSAKIKNMDREDAFIAAFLVTAAIFVLYFIIMNMITHGGITQAILFTPIFKSPYMAEQIKNQVDPGWYHFVDVFIYPPGNSQDTYMDFLNSIRDGSGLDVYQKGVIYPPLANLIFLLLAKMVPTDIVNTSPMERYAMQVNMQAMLLCLVYLVFCLICMLRFTKRYLKSEKREVALLLSYSVFAIYPIWYCIGSANILLLSLVCTTFFVFFYESENKTVREISYIMLAIAAGIKVYPALFGVLLVQKKRYFDAVRTVIYGVLAYALPGLVYGKDMLIFFQNLTGFSDNAMGSFVYGHVSIQNLVNLISDNPRLANIAFYACELIALAMVFVVPKDWQKCALVAYAILNASPVSPYTVAFMTMPFIVFIVKGNKKRKLDWIYLLLFCLLLLPQPCLYYFHSEIMQPLYDYVKADRGLLNANFLVSLPATQLMFVLLSCEGIANAVKMIKGYKENSNKKLA